MPALPEGTDVKYKITASADGLENTFMETMLWL